MHKGEGKDNATGKQGKLHRRYRNGKGKVYGIYQESNKQGKLSPVMSYKRRNCGKQRKFQQGIKCKIRHIFQAHGKENTDWI